jgi:energy-coupling factor transport system ATP-binding protein
MIEFRDVSFSYADAPKPTLSHLDMTIDEGELCVVVGPTGSGKSTLLKAVNGLVPYFTGGHLGGDVVVDGRSTRDHQPRQLTDVVGMVGQNPAASFVTDTVEDEMAYAMENLGVAPDVMRRRVEDTLDLLGLHDLRRRPLITLSGGQQQRVAIGAVLTASPRVLVLDEPTSALDPAAAEEVLASLARLVHDVGLTVLVAEHRLERVLPFADRMILVPGQGQALRFGSPGELMADSPVAPPIVELGRLAGWDPLPLSVRDARRRAGPLRQRLVDIQSTTPSDRSATRVVGTVHRLGVVYGPVEALSSIDLTFSTGQVVALMGRNGSGKSTLLRQMVGQRKPTRGSVDVLGSDPVGLPARKLIALVGLVPQDAGLLLYSESVEAECDAVDKDAGLAPGTTRASLDRVLPDVPLDRHPRDLSEGQRLALALAVVLAPAPPLLLLDEPTRGLDYPSKQRLVTVLRELAHDGHAVVLATHDVELVAQVADRAIVLADGEIVADGMARDVVCHSPVFAPQVAKVLSPERWLTVSEVRRALDGVSL